MYVDMCNSFGGDGMTAGGYLELELTSSGGAAPVTLKIRQTASTEREAWLQAIEIIEKP